MLYKKIEEIISKKIEEITDLKILGTFDIKRIKIYSWNYFIPLPSKIELFVLENGEIYDYTLKRFPIKKLKFQEYQEYKEIIKKGK